MYVSIPTLRNVASPASQISFRSFSSSNVGIRSFSSSAVAATSMTSSPSTSSVDGSMGNSSSVSSSRNSLSIEEALYLAKEAGYYTKRELQDQIIRSPPFTKSKSPFLLEQFLTPPPVQTMNLERNIQKVGKEKDVTIDDDPLDPDADPLLKLQSGNSTHQSIPNKIHMALKSMSLPENRVSSFTCHNNLEWLSRAEANGTNSRAAAHVLIRRGSGIVKVNGEEDLTSRWPLLYNRFEALLPLQVTGAACLYDVFIAVKGGGTSGQAMATRLALSRCLAIARPSCVPQLESRQLLFEDIRQKLPKEAGKAKARASYRWSKR